MEDITISAAASLTRSTIATGDLIPVLDISAAPGSKASSITKEELAAAVKTLRVGSTTSSATPTINTDNVDRYDLTAQAEAITSFTTNLSGTPTNGQALWVSITGTAARAITWGASFESGAATLPTTTVSTDRLDVLFVWNAVTSKWRCVLTTSPASGSSLPLAGGTMDENAIVNLFNGSKWQQSTPNKGAAGDAGFSVICSVGYEYKFALGFLFILSDNSTTVRKVLYAPSTPTVSDDTTLGYTTDTTWEMADGTLYRCTDVTEGAAVWEVVASPPTPPYNAGNLTGDVTLSLADGATQYGAQTGSISIEVPTGTPVEKVSAIELYVTGNGGTLDFDAAIIRASDSAASFPKTLTDTKVYLLQLRYFKTQWNLVTLVGGY